MDYDPSKPGIDRRPPTFERELEHLINRFSKENGSNTPDFLLAEYLIGCLLLWNAMVTKREEWYGRHNVGPASTGGTGPVPLDIVEDRTLEQRQADGDA